MRTNTERWRRAVLAILATLPTACAPSEVAQPKAPATAPPVAETTSTTTTTTTAALPAAATSSLNVSSDITRACGIRAESAPQAPKFDFDRSELRPDDSALLAQVAACLTTGPLRGRSIRLVGRADPRGEVEYNFALGGLRAASVANYLHTLGVDSTKTLETSRGKLDATGTDEASWQMDRRVDMDLM